MAFISARFCLPPSLSLAEDSQLEMLWAMAASVVSGNSFLTASANKYMQSSAHTYIYNSLFTITTIYLHLCSCRLRQGILTVKLTNFAARENPGIVVKRITDTDETKEKTLLF